MYSKKIFLLSLIGLCSFCLQAQKDSLLNLLNDSLANSAKPFYVHGTFKATHIVNMQTIESPAAGALNFVIQHRFGSLNSGSYNFFGLDNASLRLGLEYGLTDRLAIGIGRSSYLKTYDGSIKFKLLRQTESKGDIPVSVSIFGSVSNYTQIFPDKPFLNARYRTAYTTEVLIARKMSSRLSIQLTPTYIHYNLVPTGADKNDEFSIGGAARFKISNRMSIDGEYNYLLPNQMVSTPTHPSFSLGWDIETGGHVFQLVFSNSQSMVDAQFIGQTSGSWAKGDIYFGFNISRNFNLKKQAKHNKY
jgi:Membrane bound beta barrel domain (DUF5777)